LLGFYATAKEREASQQEARRLGLSVSDLIKRALRKSVPGFQESTI